MDWEDLIRKEIESLEKDLEAAKKKLSKATESCDAPKIMDHSVKISQLRFAINELYLIIGRASMTKKN